MHADHVRAGLGELERGGFTEAARSSENQRQAVERRERDLLGGRPCEADDLLHSRRASARGVPTRAAGTARGSAAAAALRRPRPCRERIAQCVETGSHRANLLFFAQDLFGNESEAVRCRAKIRHAARAGDDERHHAAIRPARARHPLPFPAIAEPARHAALERGHDRALVRRHGRQAVGVVVLAKQRDAAPSRRERAQEQRLDERERQKKQRFQTAAHENESSRLPPPRLCEGSTSAFSRKKNRRGPESRTANADRLARAPIKPLGRRHTRYGVTPSYALVTS